MSDPIDDDTADALLFAAGRRDLLIWCLDCRQRRNVAECKLRELEGRARVQERAERPEWLRTLREAGLI